MLPVRLYIPSSICAVHSTLKIDLPNILPPLIYLTVLFLTLALWFKMRFTDPYGLFHLTLNKLPSEDPKSPPLTEWLNMGYWKVGHTLILQTLG